MDYIPEKEQLFNCLVSQARILEGTREDVIKNLKTKEDIQKHILFVREKLKKIFGGFPPKTPLKTEMVGKIEHEKYFIEKIIYQSCPNFHVTANLYVPKNVDFPVPGILFPCGHTYNGKADKKYSKLCIGLAKRGYVVLTYDPISQGERLQYLNSSNQPELGYGVYEHCKIGNLLYLISENFASYYVWDGIRGLDYLCNRKEVDETKLGCVGNSGGGTATTYIAALDDRIKVAVPSCFITSLYKRINTRVTADPEQNFVDILKYGIDHSDILLLFAPKPLQINAAKHDFFPIEGTYKVFEELKYFYNIFDAKEKINLIVSDSSHGLNRDLREGMYNWLDKWLKKRSTNNKESFNAVEAECNLICTKTGQVLTSFPLEKTIIPKNNWIETHLPKPHTPRNKNEYRSYRIKTMRDVINITRLSDVLRPNSNCNFKTLERKYTNDYIFEKVIFKSEPDIWISAYIFHPNKLKNEMAVIFVDENGKELGLRVNYHIKSLVKDGFLVVAIDPRGMGEDKSTFSSESGYYSLYGTEADLTYSSFMVGKTLLGMRVLDIIRTVDFLNSRNDLKRNRYFCLGNRYGALISLFAAAIDSRISGVILRNMLMNYKCLIQNKKYRYHVNAFLPGVLKKFDLPNVASIIAPRLLVICNPLDHLQNEVDIDIVKEEYNIATTIYNLLNVEDKFRITSHLNYDDEFDLYKKVLLHNCLD